MNSFARRLEDGWIVQPSLHEAGEQDREDDRVGADRNPDAVHTGKASGCHAIIGGNDLRVANR